MFTVTFGTKNSYTDFGLILTSKDIGLPEPKTETVDLTGADGVIDLTEVLTDDVKYKQRKLQFTFTVIDPINAWSHTLSEVTNYIHGKRLRVLLDWDKNYYYEGRCKVNQFKTNKRLATIVVDAEVDPYKLEVNSSSTPWIWDTFSFIDGIIYLNTVTVSGSATVNLLNRRKIVSPTFTTTATMKVNHNGVTYDLPKGTTTVLGIRLQEGDNYVTFTGNGTVTIDYKGGSL
jgi:hypothetical protein